MHGPLVAWQIVGERRRCTGNGFAFPAGVDETACEKRVNGAGKCVRFALEFVSE